MTSDPSVVLASIRGRVLLAMLAFSLAAPFVALLFVWPEYLDTWDMPLEDAVLGLSLYLLLAGLLGAAGLRAGWARRFSLGAKPGRRQGLGYVLLGIPLIGVAIFSMYLLYLPLSLVEPEFVAFWLLNSPPLIWWRGDPEALLANGLNALMLVVVAPVMEEVFFRGFLLHRWRLKYGDRRAVIFSSLIFAILHVDILGGMVFGVVVSLIAMRTGSLIGPILAHGANNAIALAVVLVGTALHGGVPATSLEGFQAHWWLAPLGALVGIPWLLWFCRPLLRPEPDTA
ncbi:MAG: CPBP family intramembrane metalloprotease [Kiloniellales bacterium]|nr:CPBP family intramembrane metalloprotease [Kiloniellales bacterium]